jgi:methylenetetrahydrofolate dehydrogenase (NADP+) / methenyltetrahydrofolate cyclohydrolase
MELLHGKTIANEIMTRLKSEISLYEKKPGLAVILAGDDKASRLYVSLKEKAAAKIGMNFSLFELAENVSEGELLSLIKKLNEDDKVNGVIVQLPLPANFNAEKIISAIMPEKDVDGFHPKNIEDFLKGKGEIQPVFPQAIAGLIESSGQKVENKKAVIVANSEVFGEIMSEMLRQKGVFASYFMAKNISLNLGKIGQADIVVSAVGSPGLLSGEMIKEGAIIIDGGIEKVGNKVVGDVNPASLEAKNGFLTPVPGGVGPLTIAYLLKNTFLAFKAQQKEK